MSNKEQRSVMLFCMDRNTYCFWQMELKWPYFTLSEKYKIYEYIDTYIKKNLNSISEDLPRLYYIIGKCQQMFIVHKKYLDYFNSILYKDLPNTCIKLLSENINLLIKEKNCSLEEAQKWSLLTAIVVSWKDAYSALKAIVERGPLSHKYKLTEAIFILHLRPTFSITGFFGNIFQTDKYENEDMIFYAKCLIGALACVYKHEKYIPSDFKFEILISDSLKSSFMRNVQKLLETKLLVSNYNKN